MYACLKRAVDRDCPGRQLSLDGGDAAHGDGHPQNRWTMRLGSLKTLRLRGP